MQTTPELSLSYVPAQADRVLIAANPTAGARSRQTLLDALAKRLRQQSWDVEVVTNIDQLVAEADCAAQQGRLRAVVAAGGDGTIGLVANRMPEGTPLAVFPLGTENLLSKYLRIKADPELLCRLVGRGTCLQLDAGVARDAVQTRVFLLMVSCGFDAEVVRRVHAQRRGHIHHWSYAKPIFESIRSYQYPELRLYCDWGEKGAGGTATATLPLVARWAFIANLPQYAVGLNIVPHALGNDGLLDVCTFKEGSFWNGLMYLGGVVLGQHQFHRDCQFQRVRRIRIESTEPVPFQLDGDPGGFLPVEIEVLPRRLTLLVPEGWTARPR